MIRINHHCIIPSCTFYLEFRHKLHQFWGVHQSIRTHRSSAGQDRKVHTQKRRDLLFRFRGIIASHCLDCLLEYPHCNLPKVALPKVLSTTSACFWFVQLGRRWTAQHCRGVFLLEQSGTQMSCSQSHLLKHCTQLPTKYFLRLCLLLLSCCFNCLMHIENAPHVPYTSHAVLQAGCLQNSYGSYLHTATLLQKHVALPQHVCMLVY